MNYGLVVLNGSAALAESVLINDGTNTLTVIQQATAAGSYYLLAKVIATAVIACINYVVYRTWVFAE